MAKKKVEKVLRYNAVFEPCEEGGFTVSIPKLPGLVTEGDTFEEALVNAKDAVTGYLQVLTEAKEAIPETDDKVINTYVDINWSKVRFASA